MQIILPIYKFKSGYQTWFITTGKKILTFHIFIFKWVKYKKERWINVKSLITRHLLSGRLTISWLQYIKAKRLSQSLKVWKSKRGSVKNETIVPGTE